MCRRRRTWAFPFAARLLATAFRDQRLEHSRRARLAVLDLVGVAERREEMALLVCYLVLRFLAGPFPCVSPQRHRTRGLAEGDSDGDFKAPDCAMCGTSSLDLAPTVCSLAGPSLLLLIRR